MATAITTGLSREADPLVATERALEQLDPEVCEQADLCVMFVSGPHLEDAEAIHERVAEAIAAPALIGCGAAGVLADGTEVEEGTAVTLWAGAFDDAEIAVAHLDEGDGFGGLDQLGGRRPDGLIVLADPFGFELDPLLQEADELYPGVPLVGGLASAGTGPGRTTLFTREGVVESGAVVTAIAGVEMLPCVSQGAKPVGPPIAITAADGNTISELAFRPALERLSEVIRGLEPREREQAARGMLIGVTIDENQPEHGRGDFLIRPIVGADRESGAVAIGERVKVGQTITLHARDAESASVDLREALDSRVEALGSDGPAGALAFTCNGRGAGMFGEPNHDAGLIAERLGAPCAGFFCAGEIGPVGGRNFVHGFTATLAVFG